MFKTGGIVRCIQDYENWLTKGRTYRVDLGGSNCINVISDNGMVGGFSIKYFEPVISELSDQELADEYHRLMKEGDELRRTLHDRGYKLFVSFEHEAAQRQVTRFVDYRVFRKSVTQTIEL